MIIDTIENKDLYIALSSRIEAGLAYLAKTDFL